MRLMEEKILSEGTVLPGGILKVGGFLNQQIDTAFFREMAREVARLYENEGVTKILTIEASGIAIAMAVALEMDVPVVFAKKHKTSNVDGYIYSTQVSSFTHGTTYNVVVSCDYLKSEDKILVVDDFLANGNALLGLIDLATQSGAAVCGAAIAIEKNFQGGGDIVRARGYRVESLAKIAKMGDDGSLEFC